MIQITLYVIIKQYFKWNKNLGWTINASNELESWYLPTFLIMIQIDFSLYNIIINYTEDQHKTKSFYINDCNVILARGNKKKEKDTHEIINFGECWISISKSEILFVSAIHVLVLLLTRHDKNLHSWRSNNSQCCISCNETFLFHFCIPG